MQFHGYATPNLLRQKAEFEYTAQMCAVERLDIPDMAAEEYLDLRQEIERREQMYEACCTLAHLKSAIDECLLVVGNRSLSALLPQLSEHREPDTTADQVSLNPRNPFFQEITLEKDPHDPVGNRIKAAVFRPGKSIPIEWIQQQIPDLYHANDPASEFSSEYEVLRLVNDQAGCLKFVRGSEPGREEPAIREIVVLCW